MRKENQEMLGTLKLFWFYFFNYWLERYRFELEDSDLKADLVESSDNLYYQTRASGVVKEDFASKKYYV